LEPYFEGGYVKYNNNAGMVMMDRNTPQAFSHFTWEKSGRKVLIVDIQGVRDFYTDPQIHSADGKGFGVGNLGKAGIDKFMATHICNPICKNLGLPDVAPNSALKSKKLMLSGTMFFPQQMVERIATDAKIAPAPASCKDLTKFKMDRVLKGHEDRVSALCITGNRLFSGSGDGNLLVWDLVSFELIKTLHAHKRTVESICCDDQRVYSASDDSTITVWDIQQMKLIDTLMDHKSAVRALCVNEHFLFSASNDKTIKFWDLHSWQCVATLEGHSSGIRAMCFKGGYLFTGANDNTIKAWDIKKKECIYNLDGHKKPVKSLAVAGNYLYSGGFDKRIKQWDLSTLKSVCSVKEHVSTVTSLLACDDNSVISAGEDDIIKVWQVNEAGLKCMSTLSQHKCAVDCLAINSKYLVSGSTDYKILVWSWS